MLDSYLRSTLKRQRTILFFFVIFSCLICSHALNKYSKEANQQKDVVDEGDKDVWKDNDKPFRLAKVNLIWAKAQKVF